MNSHILLVEDDDPIRTLVAMALEEAGYAVTSCAGAEHALICFGQNPPDLLLVDLMLGPMDGFALIEEVRKHTKVPVIVLSARRDTNDIVRALEIGADDYVTKPFKEAELLARVQALLRRAEVGPRASDELSASDEVLLEPGGPTILDKKAGIARRGQEDLRLTITEYRLLADMAEAPGRVLTRELLLERVWNHDYFGDPRIVDVHVRRLRTKIEPDPSQPSILVTVRGQGYRLDLP